MKGAKGHVCSGHRHVIHRHGVSHGGADAETRRDGQAPSRGKEQDAQGPADRQGGRPERHGLPEGCREGDTPAAPAGAAPPAPHLHVQLRRRPRLRCPGRDARPRQRVGAWGAVVGGGRRGVQAGEVHGRRQRRGNGRLQGEGFPVPAVRSRAEDLPRVELGGGLRGNDARQPRLLLRLGAPSGMREEDVDMTEVFGLSMHRKEKLLLVPTTPQDHASTLHARA